LILVDSNVPMYLVGASRAHKLVAQRVVQQLSAEEQRLVTDAEVFQELLHRYRAIRRLDAIQPAFDVLNGIVDEVLPIDFAAVDRAREVLVARSRLSARDAIHVAVMQRHGIERILSFDAAFDEVPGIERLH